MFFTRALSGALAAATLVLTLGSPLFANAQVASTTEAASTSTPLVITDMSDVESSVRAYFADIPVMIGIAKCESGFTQFNTLGHTLNGGSGGMMGVYQINKKVHATFALSLGDDITTLAGNLAYARYLYNQEGTTPWVSSEGCWDALPTPAAVASIPTSTPSRDPDPSVGGTNTKITNLSVNLKLGAVSPQVATLQQLLNSAGFVVTKSGAGSPGHESSKFGALTLAAVQRFQCAKGIVCHGSEATTGYGFVGAKTRAALAQAALAINR